MKRMTRLWIGFTTLLIATPHLIFATNETALKAFYSGNYPKAHAALSAQPLSGTDVYLSAMTAVRLGTGFDSAEIALHRASRTIPIDIRLTIATKLAIKKNDPASAIRAIHQIRKATPHSPLLKQTQLDLAEYYLTVQQFENAKALLQRDFPTPESDTVFGPQVLRILTLIEIGSMHQEAAKAALIRLMSTYPGADWGETLITTYNATFKTWDSLTNLLSIPQQLNYLRAAYRDSVYGRVLQLGVAMLKNEALTTSQKVDVHHLIGRSLFNGVKLKAALPHFEAELNLLNSTQDPRWNEAHFYRGRAFSEMLDPAAIPEFRAVVDNASVSEYRAAAMLQLIDIYRHNHQDNDVAETIAQLKREFPNTVATDRADWDKHWAELFKVATTSSENILATVTSHLPKTEIHPIQAAYRSIIASAKLPIDDPNAVWVRGITSYPVTYRARNALLASRRTEPIIPASRYRVMVNCGLGDLAIKELRDQVYTKSNYAHYRETWVFAPHAQTSPQRDRRDPAVLDVEKAAAQLVQLAIVQDWIGETNHSIRNAHQSIAILQLKSANPPSRTAFRLMFPKKFEKEIRHWSPGDALDPYFVMSVIRKESLFNPNTRSPADALGLMQVLPNTAQAICRKINLLYGGRQWMMDPSTNIRLGCSYLHTQRAQFDGELAYVLSAYNAGPNITSRWKQTLPGGPVAFPNQIPYPETRNYVRDILESTLIYHFI